MVQLWRFVFAENIEGCPNWSIVEHVGGQFVVNFTKQIPEDAKPDLKLLVDLLRSEIPIPPEVRDWLADALDENGSGNFQFKGLMKRKRGPHVAGRSWSRAAAEKVEELRRSEVKYEAAVAQVSEEFGRSRSSVKSDYGKLLQVRKIERCSDPVVGT